jgi:AraC-like DNA-binding protein
MDALARHVYLSPRQLRSLFQRELGIGPKQAARLMRFDLTRQRLARQVAAGVPVNLSELAQRGGYSDHPHLTAEFGRFAGVSPSGWVEEERRNIQAGGHQRDAE